MQLMETIWLAAIIAFIIIEACTYQIVSIWFVFGAIGGMIACLCGLEFYVQMIIFAVVSGIMLIVLRPLSMKLVKKQDFKSNVNDLVGKRVLVTEDVSNIKSCGQGKINGMVWTLRGVDDTVILKGEIVTVERVEGVKLIVRK